jgi:WD40 repeat protein
MTINVFNIKNFSLRCILNPRIEKVVKCLALNPTNHNELVCYYEDEFLFFSVSDEKLMEKHKVPEPRLVEYNNDNKILIVTGKDELCYFDIYKKKLETVKTSGRVVTAKWNPFNQVEIAYANTDKTIVHQNITQKGKLSAVTLDIKSGTFITDISWYTCDESYKFVLAGTSDGYSYLLDLTQSIVIMAFEKYGNFITTVVWAKYEPGTFISFSKGSGRIAYWNVSKKSYNRIEKISNNPITRCNRLGDSKVLVTLENGGIVIYDIKDNKVDFTFEPAHSETIFGLSFNPIVKGLLATCAFDNTIKIWNINEDKLTAVLKADTPVGFYCVRWNPRDKDSITSGDAKGDVKIWDIVKQKVIASIKLGDNVQSIDWICSDESRILATSVDTVTIIKFALGKLTVVKQYKIKEGVNMARFDPQMVSFAIGCNDSTIKVYSIEKTEPVKVLTGHSKKVFGLSYNPKRQHILASSSDDCKIGIWDLNKNTHSMLTGHTNHTRFMTWLSDTENILVSSSWDGSIRFWNIDKSMLICLVNEHYSDVYGIEFSPFHPFLLISVSRDNSIRYWSINNYHSDTVNICLHIGQVLPWF